MGNKRPVKEILDRVQAKHLVALEENDKLMACCRKSKDHHVEFFKTNPNLEAADMAIYECNCGRRHYRVAVGGQE
jgi:hypothetical protein